MNNVALKEYIEKLIAAQADLTNERFQAAQKAIEKSEAAYQARFESVNEFRQTLTDQTASFVTREAVDLKIEPIYRRLEKLENDFSRLEGRMVGYSAGFGVVVLIISVVIQLVNFGGG